MNNLTHFPCSGCGSCCKRIDTAVANLGANDPASEFFFPYGYDETGRCEKLTNDNKCSVYETRPMICSIDRTADLLEAPKVPFYELNIVACNAMMEEDNVPAEFRIKSNN